MSTSEYRVTGMTCGHCEAAIRDEVGQIAGIGEIRVSAATGRLTVTGSADIEDHRIVAAVEEAGYTAERVRV